jgi:hypothetical protein
MINLFPLHDETPAPEAARDALAATKANFGMIPNLERVMAEDLALLAAYSAAWDLFGTTSLTPIERQVVYQRPKIGTAVRGAPTSPVRGNP